MSYRARAMFSAEGFSAPSDPLVGQIVQERYRIVHAIGKGAMGVVYEAQHLLIGRKVALKTMATHAVTPAGVQRFRREAQAAAAVGNSHVVDVLDMGRLDNGSFFIVMEHLDGVDLGFAVALEQRFSVGRAIHVLSQLCDALSAIHAAGIIHRDLKPENIFLTTRDGAADFVKVLDFGVCKFNDAEGTRLTATGDAIGTPLFMAPEQVEGRSDCDHRADIYALGAILYFVLTGRAPFDAPNMPALFLRICHEPAPSLASTDSDLSFELDAIVQRALSKDPNARFSSCAAFKSALRSLQTTSDEIAATLPGAVDASRVTEYAWGHAGGDGSTSLIRTQPRRRPRWLGAAIGVSALAVSVSAGAYLVRAHEAGAPPRETSVNLSSSKAAAAPPEAPSGSQPVPAVGLVIAASERDAPKDLAKNKTPAPSSSPQPRVPKEQLAAPPAVVPTVSAEPATAPAPPAEDKTSTGSTTVNSSAAALHLTKGLKGGL